jgi:hypothetical protein
MTTFLSSAVNIAIFGSVLVPFSSSYPSDDQIHLHLAHDPCPAQLHRSDCPVDDHPYVSDLSRYLHPPHEFKPNRQLRRSLRVDLRYRRTL